MPIHYEKHSGGDDEHIVLITIDRPEARNSADMEHFKQLREAWERFRDDADAWVAIITGVGDAFFVGADLKKYIPEITKIAEKVLAEGLEEWNGYRLDDGMKAVLREFDLHKPVIAAVNGFCAAGGMEMLGGTDLRVACPEARFAVMEPKRGLFAGGGTTVRLPRQIPWPQAMELLLCADLIDAARAYEMGLLNAVVPRDELLSKAYEYARRIIVNAPLAIQATKQSALSSLYAEADTTRAVRDAVRHLTRLLDGLDTSDAGSTEAARREALEVLSGLGDGLRTAFEQEMELSARIFSTEDAKEGPKAFAEKRKPEWRAR